MEPGKVSEYYDNMQLDKYIYEIFLDKLWQLKVPEIKFGRIDNDYTRFIGKGNNKKHIKKIDEALYYINGEEPGSRRNLYGWEFLGFPTGTSTVIPIQLTDERKKKYFKLLFSCFMISTFDAYKAWYNKLYEKSIISYHGLSFCNNTGIGIQKFMFIAFREYFNELNIDVSMRSDNADNFEDNVLVTLVFKYILDYDVKEKILSLYKNSDDVKLITRLLIAKNNPTNK